MHLRHWERIRLLEAPGTIEALGSISLESPFVVGIELASGDNTYHHRISELEQTGNVAVAEIMLPKPKAQRLCELFRRLYSSDRMPPPGYDCRAGLDFLIGASDDIVHTVDTYNVRGPMQPNNLEPAQPYIILADSTVHDFLAADNATGLHIAGPGGELGHTPAVDLMHIWEGTLQKVTGWEL